MAIVGIEELSDLVLLIKYQARAEAIVVAATSTTNQGGLRKFESRANANCIVISGPPTFIGEYSLLIECIAGLDGGAHRAFAIFEGGTAANEARQFIGGGSFTSSKNDDAPMIHTGGCLCGLVRYQNAAAPDHSTVCHCNSCRRASGVVAVGWATFPLKGFELVGERPAEFRSSPGVVRTFCSTCGTPLTYWHEHWPDSIDIAIGTLDVPDDVVPSDHTWMSDAVSWDVPTDGLIQHLRSRP